MRCQILPVGFDKGASKQGCSHAPHAILAGGLMHALNEAGQSFDVVPYRMPVFGQKTDLKSCWPQAWHDVARLTRSLSDQAFAVAGHGLSVFIGGDHSISAGSISGMARYAARCGRPFFVLWLDAHPDFHTLETTQTGNLHGVPLAYVSGQAGFSSLLPKLETYLRPDRICVMGLRSVDRDEEILIARAGIEIQLMADLHRKGVKYSLMPFLEKVRQVDGLLHVSLDIDFLDPKIACGVGTPVPNGATLPQAYEIIDHIAQSRLLTSLDIVEYNPTFDEAQQTLALTIDLTTRMIKAGTNCDAKAGLLNQMAG
jgi:arginase